MDKTWAQVRNSLNFFRIHAIFFTVTPLVFSGIFYASNGEFHISYIDALFNCVSAMTVTGLTTVDLSSLTGWQQAILFIQQCLGSLVAVSWVMVYIRRRYFEAQFKDIVRAAIASRGTGTKPTEAEGGTTATPWKDRLQSLIIRRTYLSTVDEHNENEEESGPLKRTRSRIVTRTSDLPKPIDPSGAITEEPVDEKDIVDAYRNPARPRKREMTLSDEGRTSIPPAGTAPGPISVDTQGPFSQRTSSLPHEPQSPRTAISGVGFPRSQTVEFKTPPKHRPSLSVTETGRRRSVSTEVNQFVGNGDPFVRTTTMHTYRSERSAMHRGMGGFPAPQTILIRLFRKFFPSLADKFFKRVTFYRNETRATTGQGQSNPVPYISFDAVVGRNSRFHMLTDENLEELGGVEYRALNALLWIIGGYHIGIQLISFVVISPYISADRWQSAFTPPQLHRYVPPVWYSAFQVVSAYTNSGMSLVDQSMIPFHQAYPMIVFMVFCILAGNTAFPVFLRFTIWTISKVVPHRSRTYETLRFLLDHPRRCFVYLFPSHQTWYLFWVLVMLNFTDWFFFLVLDIGNPLIDKIPLGIRFIIGLLQATAVRASGFGTVSLSSLAPAVLVLYVVMMYISVYPLAISVRSTNVYEERSLGVFEDEEDYQEPSVEGPRLQVWSRYIAWHARKQLAFDMWWLGLALFLVCIIERSEFDNPDNLSWFTIFAVLFELISAYGTVGLSLGLPFGNYSLSGAFKPLSKLIVCAVMIRGRHRGLPVAIDRAILLPDLYKEDPHSGSEFPPGAPGQVRSRAGTLTDAPPVSTTPVG